MSEGFEASIDEGPGGNKKRERRIQVPYWRDPNTSYEAIHLNVFEPAFLCYDKSRFWTVKEITLADAETSKTILEPVKEVPYTPYHFTDEEIKELPTTMTSGATQTLFQKTLESITPHQDTVLWHRQVDAAAILLSYQQDKVDSVPYIWKLGAPESGKSRSCALVNWHAYRPLMAVDLTPANVYRYYGKLLQGAGTIIHDEADDGAIDNDKALKSIYNSGYTFGARVPRIGGDHQEQQDFWNCYGVKWFNGTELPFNKAFRSRLIVQHFMQGNPQKIDITDADKEQFKSLRKELLVYRLLRSFERFEQVNTGLIGRSRELYTPMLAVLHKTEGYNVLLQPLLELDKLRRKEDRESKPAYIAKAVIEAWLNAAAKVLHVDQIESVNDLQLSNLKEKVSVSNLAVIAQLGMTESTNDKGKKILVSDEIPFSFTVYDIGRIQSENLKGVSDVGKDENRKSIRIHWYDLDTIKRLHLRYVSTLSTDNGEG